LDRGSTARAPCPTAQHGNDQYRCGQTGNDGNRGAAKAHGVRETQAELPWQAMQWAAFFGNKRTDAVTEADQAEQRRMDANQTG
jgi:hypothetical protein